MYVSHISIYNVITTFEAMTVYTPVYSFQHLNSCHLILDMISFVMWECETDSGLLDLAFI